MAKASKKAAACEDNGNVAVMDAPASQAMVPVEPTQEQLAIACLKNSAIAVCRPGNRAMAVAEANGESLSFGNLTRVKTPSGGGTNWQYEELGNAIVTPSISGVLVIWQKRAILWPTEGDAAEGTQPVLISNDLRRAFMNPRFDGNWGDVDQDLVEEARIEGTEFFDMERLHYSQFGTGKGKGDVAGKGKRMKEQRIIGLLHPDSVYPLIINASPGSLGNVVPVIAKLGNFHYQTMVTLTLEDAKSQFGQKYSRICMAVDGYLTDPEGDFLRRKFTEPLTKAIRDGEVSVD